MRGLRDSMYAVREGENRHPQDQADINDHGDDSRMDQTNEFSDATPRASDKIASLSIENTFYWLNNDTKTSPVVETSK